MTIHTNDNKFGLILLVILALLFAATNSIKAVMYHEISTNDGTLTGWDSVLDANSQTDVSGGVAQPDLDIVKGWVIRGNDQAFSG